MTTNHRMVLCCWIAALLFGMFAVYCWVQDPFFEKGMNVHMGSLVSYAVGCGSAGMSLVLGVVGLVLARRILLLLGLVNLVMFAAAAVCLASGALAAPWSPKSLAGWTLLGISVLTTAAIIVLRRKRRPTEITNHDGQGTA